MTTRALPAGWSVEMLGLISAVRFTRKDAPYELVWCDNEWRMCSNGPNGRVSVLARGVPEARSMKEARRVGEAWIREIESEEA